MHDGFDGPWVIHHDLVKVCTDVFSEDFEECRNNQKRLLPHDIQVTPDIMLSFQTPEGSFMKK